MVAKWLAMLTSILLSLPSALAVLLTSTRRDHQEDLKSMDKENTDGTIRIAIRRVCWVILVKITPKGFKLPCHCNFRGRGYNVSKVSLA